MEIFITHFTNLRFLAEDQIPVSTAMWDPKWFHPKNMNNTGVYKYHLKSQDRDQWYGYRIEELKPWACGTHCINCDHTKFNNCPFLKEYHQQLFEKTSFEKVLNNLKLIQQDYETKTSIKDAKIVLLVYEKEDNPCSERWDIIKWFLKNNIVIKNWKKEA